MWNKRNILVLIVILVIAFILLPIELPISVSSKGKLLPIKSWTLSKGTDGRLITSLTDNSNNLNSEFSVTQVERGDAVQFKFNLDIIGDNYVSQGDTIGYMISSEIEKDINKLKGELETAKASLKIETSSEKESVIEAEKNKLAFAEKELEEQMKLFNRKKQLYEKDLISLQEFEADEAKYELAKINIDIANERLRTVQSGAKEEEIKFATVRIKSIENQIKVLQKRFESNNIVSPFSGIINKPYGSDTLLVVNDISQYVCLIPIKWEEIHKIVKEQKVSISSEFASEIITGRIVEIDNVVNSFNQNQYVLVTVLTDTKIEQLKPGLIVDCSINCGSAPISTLLVDFIKPIISL